MLESRLYGLMQNPFLRSSCLASEEMCCALIEVFLDVLEGINV